MKCLLNVWIALSARLLRCVSGGTSCILQLFLITSFSSAGASLSRICNLGVMTFELVNRFHKMRYVFTRLSVVLLFIGSASM